jgi:dienelactone hydrolase
MSTLALDSPFLLAAGFIPAQVVAKPIAYEHEGVKLEGLLAYDSATTGPRPGVLVLHEWWGLDDHARMRTRQLAEMGYVAFAADLYGGARTTHDTYQAVEWMSAIGDVPGLMVARSRAGLDVLRRQAQTDRARLAAVGFCLGGAAALDLACSGETLEAAVAFHSELAAPDDLPAKQVKGTLLVLHGAADPFVRPESVDRLRGTLEAAKVDWHMITYANAAHGFTNPDADRFQVPGVAHNPMAARHSWKEMQRLLKEKLAKQS